MRGKMEMTKSISKVSSSSPNPLEWSTMYDQLCIAHSSLYCIICMYIYVCTVELLDFISKNFHFVTDTMHC